MAKDRPVGQRAAKRQDSIDASLERYSSSCDKRQKTMLDALAQSNKNFEHFEQIVAKIESKNANDKFMLGLAALNNMTAVSSDVQRYLELRKLECLREVGLLPNINKEENNHVPHQTSRKGVKGGQGERK